MKKMILGLCALFACFVMTSCGADPKETLKDLETKAKEAKTADDILDVQKDACKAMIDFLKENTEKPDPDALKEFQTLYENIDKAFNEKAEKDEEFKKALKEADEKAEKDDEVKKLKKDMKEALEAFVKAQLKAKEGEGEKE